jgi:hypothetical protein
VVELSDEMTAEDLPGHFRVRGGNEGARSSDASESPFLEEDSSASSLTARPISSSPAAPPKSSFPEEAREVLGFWGSRMEIPRADLLFVAPLAGAASTGFGSKSCASLVEITPSGSGAGQLTLVTFSDQSSSDILKIIRKGETEDY